MSSPLQIEASRANGRRSQGPVTPEGEAKAARNNRRHGMLAKAVVLEEESREHFQQLLDDFIAEFKPATQAEMAKVEIMVAARWRQMRVWSIEKSDIDREMARHDPTVGPAPLRAAIVFRSLADHTRALDLYHRYDTAYDRKFDKALNELMRLQARRGNSQLRLPLPSVSPETWKEENTAFCDSNPGSC